MKQSANLNRSILTAVRPVQLAFRTFSIFLLSIYSCQYLQISTPCTMFVRKSQWSRKADPSISTNSSFISSYHGQCICGSGLGICSRLQYSSFVHFSHQGTCFIYVYYAPSCSKSTASNWKPTWFSFSLNAASPLKTTICRTTRGMLHALMFFTLILPILVPP